MAQSQETRHLVVPEEELHDDLHWKAGLRCHDCHGGHEDLQQFADHRNDPTFRSIATAANVPGFCGHCHSNFEYMRQFRPLPVIHQEAEYWTGGHGQKLKNDGDHRVATCVSCHGGHGMLAVDDLRSPVYPTHVAETCASCHANAELMDGRTYHGRPLGHQQFDEWMRSVHARTMFEKNDLSAPTCNVCHGSHGPAPPGLDAVTDACGMCHIKEAELFATTQMKHRFEAIDLPGCGTCHGYHEIRSPTDKMLGMGEGTLCIECHADGRYGATLAGAEVAEQMHHAMELLKNRIAEAEAKLDAAQRLGMEVRIARFELQAARDSQTTARSLVHAFAVEPLQAELDKGLEVTTSVQAVAQRAIREHSQRRIWLGVSLIPLLLAAGLLIAYIRTLPSATDDSHHGDSSGQA